VTLASGNVPVEYRLLADGFRGTDATVELMRQLTTGQYGTRSPKIRALAINILKQARVPEKDYPAEMVAIHNWVRDNIRYTRDVHGQETLCPPEEIAFNSKSGDCDDKAMLDAALLGAVGIPTRFKVLGVTPQRYSHVYLEANVGGRWIPLDPIMRGKPAGWEAPPAMRAIEKVYPENVPQGITMNMHGLHGLGYVGDPRIVSHLEAEPPPLGTPGPGYVQMNSFLDNDAPIEQLSNDQPVFGQNANVPPRTQPMARQSRATLQDRRMPSAAAAAQANEEELAYAMAERAAMEPGEGLHDVYLPEQLAALGLGYDKQPIQRNMQRPAMALEPEGIDVAFGRNALVMNARRGDRILYRGGWALNEKPPIRRLGVGGLGGFAPGTTYRGMLPGMGYLGRQSLSGPGLADLAEDAPAAPAPAPAPAPSHSPTLFMVAAAAAALYFFTRRK
jgi:hypothetical protein